MSSSSSLLAGPTLGRVTAKAFTISDMMTRNLCGVLAGTRVTRSDDRKSKIDLQETNVWETAHTSKNERQREEKYHERIDRIFILEKWGKAIIAGIISCRKKIAGTNTISSRRAKSQTCTM